MNGRRSGFGSALRMSSRTIHGTLPSPKSKKPSTPENGDYSVQPKWISGGLPTLAISSATAASVWAIDAAWLIFIT